MYAQRRIEARGSEHAEALDDAESLRWHELHADRADEHHAKHDRRRVGKEAEHAEQPQLLCQSPFYVSLFPPFSGVKKNAALTTTFGGQHCVFASG